MQDGYAQDQFGLHHRVLSGVVEAKSGTDWWACPIRTLAVPCTWTCRRFKGLQSNHVAVTLLPFDRASPMSLYCRPFLPQSGHEVLLA